ncbi:hypothetical protein CNBE3250 [Cryptococcus deneoformans B-3501A]|uniref:hypothetical protein n=1 Tax=Cryptococcus deneoformans (strain B-3501A) TaxID=283643 RepID=UPI000042D4E8|nr:hypothetical protein CNBE3250 [Cryptococcus neoformans var. neoformans B-3501A]EAL20617.1 hypothetical protein CNBE3250 [Cryptococcus neoformans var. neoformans B-3501A]
MPKANKSSASAGTRKKHAAKKTHREHDDDSDHQPESGTPQPSRKQRGEKKLSKAQKRAIPKVKQYIPPPKPPAPPILDPLDGQGLARTLPADLVVVLRRLGKKDAVTRRKGLEEFRDGWVKYILKEKPTEEEETEREVKEIALLAAIPVWSPFHRAIALLIHTDLLSVPALRASILESLNLGLLPGTQNRDVLGSWMIAALEEGRRAGGLGLRGWESSILWKASGEEVGGDTDIRIDLKEHLSTLIEYLTLSTLNPSILHEDIHPIPVAATPVSSIPLGKKGTNKQGKSKTSSAPPSRQTETPVPPPEDHEILEERMTRYRVGGLIGLSWLLQQLPQVGLTSLPEDLVTLLRHPALWLSLSSEQVDTVNSPGSLGTAQPPVRKAGYGLLDVLVNSYESIVAEPEMLKMVSNAVLSSCWREKEAVVWESAGSAIAKFIRKSAADHRDGRNDGRNDGEEEVDSEDENVQNADDEDGANPATLLQLSSPYYSDFLDFTSTICPYIPHITYPIILVVLSTLPPSLLLLVGPSLQLQTLFSHLWAPLDSRLLSTHCLPGQKSAFQAFFQAILECTIFLIGKSWKEEDGKEAAMWLVKEQLGNRAWKEGVLLMGGRAGGRHVPRGCTEESEASAFGSTLGRLASIDQLLLDQIRVVLTQTLSDACFPQENPESGPMEVSILPRSLSILSAISDAIAASQVIALVDQLMEDLIEKLSEVFVGSSKSDNPSHAIMAETLVDALKNHHHLVHSDTIEKLLGQVKDSSHELLIILHPPLFIAYLDSLCSKLPSAERHVCQQALSTVLQSSEIDSSQRFTVANAVLILDHTQLLQSGSLDQIVKEATHDALAGGSPIAIPVVTASLKSLCYLSKSTLDEVLSVTCSVIRESTKKLLTTDFVELGVPQAAFEIFAAYATNHLQEVIESEHLISGLVSVHHVLFVLPRLPGHIASAESKASGLLSLWSKLGELVVEYQEKVLQRVYSALKGEMGDVEVRVDPEVLIDVALATTLGSHSAPSLQALVLALLPEVISIIQDLAPHTSQPPHPSLPIVDPLIPFVPHGDDDLDSIQPEFDSLGRAQTARYAEAAVALLRADRSLVKDEPALLQMILAVSRLAQDALTVPGASRGLFSKETPSTRLADLVREVEGAISFALGYVDEVEPSWHHATIHALKSGSVPHDSDLLQSLMVALQKEVTANGNDVDARSFRDVLYKHMRQIGAGVQEGEAWLNYAMSLVDRSPQLSLAIITAIKPLMLDTQAFATAQTRLASALTTIPPSKCHTALNLLRIFNASAPEVDSTSVFLPQQRALFVLRHVAGWLTSDDVDEDKLPEDMEFRVLELEGSVAPIVQDVGGAHWDGIFDLVENGLENSGMDDSSSLCLLYHSLSVLQQIRDLCQTNKSLRASWTSKTNHMKLVLDLFLQCRSANSVPLQLIQNLILDLLPDVPEQVMKEASLTSLCNLISLSTSSAIQTAAYRIISQVIRHQTVGLVLEVEASVAQAQEGHAERTIEMAKELVDVVKIGSEVNWHGELGVSLVLGQLLAWMSILDYFEDASRTLRWAYLDQLNTSKLITDGLVPMLFSILGVSEMGAWNFPASQYAVDEFFTEFLDPESLPDLSPLASHLFYRALVTIPSSVRAYYESLKDRQLSMSMLSFTARHYSPVIIAHEFSALREPSAMAQLTEEGLNVRIAQGGGATIAAGAGSAEAIASYVVDEQPMEIGIRLPAEFPLKGVDVRDLRRVGVPENKWRGWLMGLQQTITSRNGLILEALTMFKKNVSLHFEGVVECAICYSIISLTDRTLPTKPCRTCKNRFHASCLFKWFNSSHSSSCPLCRALF